MSKYNLTFIEDSDLFDEVAKVLNVVISAAAEAEAKLYNNVIDPFSAVFDSIRQGISVEDWLEQEKSRQIQKTFQNSIGDFHQAVLGHIGDWQNLHVGGVVDLQNDVVKVIAEIKNKHNTTKGNHKKVIYDDLLSLLTSRYQGYIGYYVEIVPKSRTPYDKPFTPSDNETQTRRPENKDIRVIDGRSFYGLVTGVPNALDQLYYAIPLVIADVLGRDPLQVANDPLYQELFKKAYPFS